MGKRLLPLIVLSGFSTLALGPARAQDAPPDAPPAPATEPALLLEPVDCGPRHVPGPAAEPSRSDARKAKKLASSADRSCRKGRFAECAASLLAAHAGDGAAAHLRALGDAYRAAEDMEAAVCAYRQYLSAAPEAEDKAAVEERLAALEQARVARHERQAELAAALAQVEREVDCASSTWSGPATEPDRKAVRLARKLAESARRACDKKQYVECVKGHRDAYAAGGDQAHVRAAALAYENLADYQSAICAYRSVLSATPASADAEQLSGRMARAFVALEDARRRAAEIEAAAEQAMKTVDCAARDIPAPAPEAADARKAERLGKSADRECADKDFKQCAASLRQAFEADGNPDHLRKLGSAYASAQEYHGAVCALRQYQSLAPATPYSDQVRLRLAENHEKLVAERREQARVTAEITKATDDIRCAERRLQPPNERVSRRNKDKARDQVNKAQELCKRQQLEECAEALKSAFLLDGDPIHLLSLAFQHGQLKDYDNAICVYQQFLDSSPDPRYVDGAYQKLASLSQDYNKQKETEKSLVETTKNLGETKEVLEKTAEERDREAQAKTEAQKEAQEKGEQVEKLATELSKTTTWIGAGRARSTKGSTRRHIGTGLLGLGALSVGMGVLYGLDARHTQRTIEGASGWGAEFDDLVAHGQTANQRTMIFSAAGGALIIGGAVLYYLGERASKNVEVEIEVPSDITGTAAVRMGGRF